MNPAERAVGDVQGIQQSSVFGSLSTQILRDAVDVWIIVPTMEYPPDETTESVSVSGSLHDAATHLQIYSIRYDKLLSSQYGKLYANSKSDIHQ